MPDFNLVRQLGGHVIRKVEIEANCSAVSFTRVSSQEVYYGFIC